MADWRGKQDHRDQPSKKETDPIPKSLPVIPPIPKSSISNSNWRGNTDKSSPNSEETVQRRWTGSADPVSSKPKSFRRTFIAGFIAVATLVCCAVFYAMLMPNERPLPLHLSVLEDYRNWGYGENYFGKQTVSMFRSMASNSPYVEIRTDKDATDGLARQLALSSKVENQYAFQLGGPNNRVTGYFFSSVLVHDESTGDVWMLHGGKEDSTASNMEGNLNPIQSTSLSIKSLFERIADATPPNSYAWIILDCKQSPEIASAAKLEFPASSIEKVYQDTQHKERLIVTLPCKDKEENWLAPEYGCTWFARAIFDGLAHGFDSDNSVMSVEDFHAGLAKRVNSDVAARRHATQTPWCLMEAKTPQSSFALVRSTRSKQESSGIVRFRTQKSEIEGKFKVLDDLWARCQKLHRCVSSHPVEYSLIEENLVLLEDFAEHNSPSFTRIASELEHRIQKLERDQQFARRVSLLEARLHGSAIYDGEERYQKCQGLWNSIESAAAQDDARLWQDTFAPEKLRKAIGELPPLPSNQKEWLEIQWLKIIVDDVAWPNTAITSRNFETAALLVRFLSVIQRIHCNPNFELSRWTRAFMEDTRIDELLTQSMDQLIVGRFDEANSSLKQLRSSVESIQSKIAQLEEAVFVRDYVLHYLPHVIVWQCRQERYGEFENRNDKARWAKELSLQWSALTRTAKSTAEALSNDKVLSIDNLQDAGQKFRSLLDEIRMEQKRILENKERDPQLARFWRNIVRFPKTDADDRREFHRRLIEFYDAEQPAGGKSEKIAHLPPSTFYEPFFAEIKRNENDWFARSLVFDGRLQQVPQWARDHQNDLPQVNSQQLYSIAQQAKQLANSVGQTLSNHEDIDRDWPFSAPNLYRQLCMEAYAKRHVERHCLWQLGDGDLRSRNRSSFYFSAISQPYIDWIAGIQEKQLSGYTGDRIRNADFEKIRNPALQTLSRLNWELATTRQDSAIRISRQESAGDPPLATSATAGVSIAKANNRLERLAIDGELVKGIRLDRNDTLEISLSNPSLDSKVFFSYRGHYQSESIPRKESDKSYSITFARQSPSATLEVAVDTVRPEEFVILLDCSGSFGNTHQNAKAAISKLLHLLRDIDSDRIRQVHVQLMVFGRAYRAAELDPKSAPPPGLVRTNNQILATKMLANNADRFDAIRKTVENAWIRPDAGTPLFDAIVMACADKQKGIRRNIVVISDGINDIEGWKPAQDESVEKWSSNPEFKKRGVADPYDGPCHSFEDVTKELQRTKTQIYVYQFFDPTSNDKEREGAKGFQERSRKEWTFADPKRLILYQSWNEVESAIKQQFQLPQVVISDAMQTISTGNLNREIALPPEARSISISTDTTAKMEIRLQGNENVQLKYDPDKNQLTCIPFDQEQREYRLSPQFRAEQPSERRLLLGVTKRVNENEVFVPKVVMRGASEDAELLGFMERPKYALAEIRKSNDRQSRSILLADWIFEHQHYPSILFPAVKWKQKRDSKPHPFDMQVWLFDRLSDDDWRTISIGPNENTMLKDFTSAVITCKRANNQLTVEIQNQTDEQYFVACRDSQFCQHSVKAENDFPVAGSEQHQFQIDDSVPVASVDIIPLSRLKNRKVGTAGFEAFTILDQIP